jgi:hypothetical protein
MAQLQELGTLDPAARERLMEDLKQTDPRLWPDVIRQFRATLAYRQQAGAKHPSEKAPAEAEGATVETVPNGTSQASGSPADASRVSPAETVPQPPAPALAVQAAASNAGGGDRSSLKETQQRESAVPMANMDQKPPAEETRAHREAGRVEQASYTSDDPKDWQGELEDTIRAVEANVPSSPGSAEEVAQHARLRMLYLLAGRRDDALRPIPSTSPSVQDFWAKELYGLSAWLDTQRNNDPTRRAAEAKQHLSEAIARLSETAPLVVRNLGFVTDIQGFGNYKKFAEYKFTPGQEVLLYAEVENFASEPTEDGYQTELRFGYQIFDSRGQRVADHESTSKERCLNVRRDFYIGYRFHMPTRIYDGTHTLQLTVEDLQSQKIGQSSIEFTIEEKRR